MQSAISKSEYRDKFSNHNDLEQFLDLQNPVIG